MKLTLHFFLLNEHFSPEYAEANHKGQETENNPKYEWEDELEISDLSEYEIIRSSDFPLQGELPNGTAFSENLTKMFTVRVKTNAGQEGFLGVSESILDRFEEDQSSENPGIRVYLKDFEPHANPMPGVYVASKEFPKALIF